MPIPVLTLLLVVLVAAAAFGKSGNPTPEESPFNDALGRLGFGDVEAVDGPFGQGEEPVPGWVYKDPAGTRILIGELQSEDSGIAYISANALGPASVYRAAEPAGPMGFAIFTPPGSGVDDDEIERLSAEIRRVIAQQKAP